MDTYSVGYFKTMGNPRTDWCYKTQPDTGLNGRSINCQGKDIGRQQFNKWIALCKRSA